MSRGWQRAVALLLLAMLLPAAPAMGAMTVSVNHVEISLDTRDIPLTSGTQIVIRSDLTEPQKAGGDGNESERKDNDVTLVLVQGVFMDDTRRDSLLGFKDQADAIDDNEFPPDYDRYTIRFPESGPSGYAAEGSYIGEIEFTVTARNESGGNISQQQFWVYIGPGESEDTFELKLPTLPSLDTMLPILGIGLLLLLVSFGVWHFVLKP
ncbi:MAG: hypothetical protein VX863_00500, partial [Candidatus Thermoplasmatota archaeon]|nr:hypothetical protein [Candidatus Thermoplasmatota archaeon]